MTDRRITNSHLPPKDHDPLKELAGRVQKLSYSDMKKFAGKMCPGGGADEFADCLVRVAEEILNGETK